MMRYALLKGVTPTPVVIPSFALRTAALVATLTVTKYPTCEINT